MTRASIVVAFVVALSPCTQAQEPAVILKHDGWVAAVTFSPDGKTLASAGADNVVRLWEVGTWKAKGVLEGHKDCVCALSFAPSGDLMSGSFDRSAIGWNIEKKTAVWTSKKHPGVVLSVDVVPDPKGAVPVTASTDGVIRVWTNEAVAQELKIARHRSWANSLKLTKDVAASGGSDGNVHLFNFANTLDILEGGAGEVRSVAFSPDGKLLAAGNRYHTVRVWDVESKKEIKTLAGHMSDVWSIAFSPDGKTLAAADTDWKKASKVKLWDTTTWKERGAIDVPGEILSIAYSPKGDWLAVGSWDKTVRVFAIK